jgi:tRNA(Ile)-lysidine synthase
MEHMYPKATCSVETCIDMIRLDRSLIPKEDFCVAVSGGIDSIACLHLLSRLYKDKVSACHFNHNFQSTNAKMQRVVERFCSQHNIKLVLGKRTNFNDNVKHGIEDHLRKERLKFFSSLNKDIIVCHHLNDAVESYLMNTLKGCPEYTPIPIATKFHNNNHKMIRPFLKTKKSNIKDYIDNNNLWEFVVEDPTNNDTKYRRNFIRNSILPNLNNFGLEKIVYKKFYCIN